MIAHSTALTSHTESCIGDSAGTGVLPARKQAEAKIYERDTAGEGAPCAVFDYFQGDSGSWRCSSAVGGCSGTLLLRLKGSCIMQKGEIPDLAQQSGVLKVQADWT